MYINRQMSIIIFFVMIFALSFSFYQADAQINFETDEPTFDTSNPGLNVQDFQAPNPVSTSFLICEAPVNENSNDACFSPGQILPGIEFLDNPGPDNTDGLLVLGDNLFGSAGNPSNLLSNNTFGDAFDIEFTGLTDRVGLRPGCVLNTATCTRTIVVSVFGAMDNLLDTTTISVTEAADSFIGIESTERISRISLDFDTPASNHVKTINDVKFNSAPLVDIVDVNNGACALTKSSLNGFKVEGATPDSNVAVVMGLQYGSLIVNGPVCNGLELGVQQARVFAIAKADELGNAMFLAPVPPLSDLIGSAFFQVVDINTCTAGGVKMYDILIDEIQSNDNDGDGVANCLDACPDQGLPGPGQGLGEDGCITDVIIIE